MGACSTAKKNINNKFTTSVTNSQAEEYSKIDCNKNVK